jgi:putative transposase
MPQRNTIRWFTEEGIYHIYNRGVEKRDIFLDDQDYAVFLHLLKYYLSPIDPKYIHPLLKFQNFTIVRPRPLANLEKEVDLIIYCLMPNHFHLIIKQHAINGVTNLVRRVSTTYAMYFNKRYKRVGYLFQGRYRAKRVETEEYLLHLSRYVHLNPSELTGSHPVSYPYSSYKYYLGEKHASWLKTDLILSYFDKNKMQPFLKHYPSYKEFVEGNSGDSKEIVGNLILE